MQYFHKTANLIQKVSFLWYDVMIYHESISLFCSRNRCSSQFCVTFASPALTLGFAGWCLASLAQYCVAPPAFPPRRRDGVGLLVYLWLLPLGSYFSTILFVWVNSVCDQLKLHRIIPLPGLAQVSHLYIKFLSTRIKLARFCTLGNRLRRRPQFLVKIMVIAMIISSFIAYLY